MSTSTIDEPRTRVHLRGGGDAGCEDSLACTFFAALEDEGRVQQQLLALAERVRWRARKRRVEARTVSLELSGADWRSMQP